MHNDWAFHEMRGVRLWDARCRATLVTACERLAEHAETSFSSALGSGRKAVSRILHHETTSAPSLLAGHVKATCKRCRDHAFVLVASDTTVCDFTSHKATQGLGGISPFPLQKGFLVHTALALSPEGVPLGIVHQQSWVRVPPLPEGQEDGEGGVPKASEPEVPPQPRPFAERESHKWVEALQGVEAALPAPIRALLVQDREADVFAFLVAPRREGIDLLVRAVQPRRLETETDRPAHSLQDAVAHAPLVGTHTVTVAGRPGQSGRTAHLTLRLASVTVKAPRTCPEAVRSVCVRVIRASEETPPPGVSALEWVLITTLPVPYAATCRRLVGYYALRWRIERFHFVLKSGCRLERLQLDTFVTLQKAVSLYSIVAWHLLHLLYLARETPDAPVETAISERERQVLELATGKAITTVGEVVKAVARLVGFVPVPSAPDPGVKTLWLGFRKLQNLTEGFLLAKSRPPPL